MWEFVFQLMGLAILGLVIGVGVLIYQENQRVRDFVNKRPVLAFPLILVTGGIVMTAIMYGLTFVMLTVVNLILGHGVQ
jgi:hypothetical protein